MTDNQLKLFFLLFGFLILACDGAPRGRAALELEDWRVSAEPSAVIGGGDEGEGYLLQRVAGATRMADGRIVIADQGSAEIIFYDSLGTHLNTVGGKGEGPGEYQGIIQMQRMPGDTLLILSFRPGLTWLSPQGEYLRSERVSLFDVARVPCRIGESSWYALRDGSILTVLEDNFGFDPCPPSPSPPWRQTGLIARSTTFDGTFDTLGIFPATERNSPNYRAYGRIMVLGLGPDRVYAGDTGSREIFALNFQGDTLQTYETPWEAIPVPPEAKREDVRRFELPDGTVQVGNPYLYPERYPLFGRLLVDQAGFLWVMAYPELLDPISSPNLERVYFATVEEGGARWRVMGPGGQVITELRTPPRLFPLEIGEGYVLGVSKDEWDVQSIQLHALVR